MKFEKKEVYSYKVIKLFTKPLIFFYWVVCCHWRA